MRVRTNTGCRRIGVWPDGGRKLIIEALGVGSDAQEVRDMDGRPHNVAIARGTLLLLGLILIGACAAPTGRGVGSQPASVVLTFANSGHEHQYLEPFADAASLATDGTVKIEFKDQVHKSEPAYETKIIDDVVKGDYDLGWVAPRPWHDKGVMSFDALMAPFLIDTYALQAAVLGGDLEDQMLAGLDGSGLVGLGIAPGPLRRIATDGIALDGPESLAGKVVAINDSAIARMTFEGLGATTVSIPGGGALGDAVAVEQQFGSILGNRYHHDLGDVVADLALWPRPLILFANQSAFQALSDAQQDGLRAAADQYASWSLADAEAEDESAIRDLCADGANLVVAGAEARAALLAAVQPVYVELAKDAPTKAFLDRIADLKAATAAPAAAASCAMAEASPTAASRGGFPDGIYEARLSCAELEAFWADHPTPAEMRFPCPMVMGFTLDGDSWVENYGEKWNFSFLGDHVELGDFTMRWTFDGKQLTFSDMVGGAPGHAQAWTTKPFTKLDKSPIPDVGFPDGTYVAQISSDEMRAFWEANDVPLDMRVPCPCESRFSLENGVWTGDDGSTWTPSFFGNHLTLTDREGEFTLRWRFDPQVEEVTFSDVEAPEGDRIGLEMFFKVKAFDRVN
jgi:TRAP-type C4-dicarboxylate transport system substrate-binding protein